LLLASLVASFGCPQSRSDNIVELQRGFRGWVAVEFERADCPPLTKRGDAWYLHVPESGYLCTSNPLEEGWATDTFFEQGRESTPYASAGPSDPESTHDEVRVRGFVVGNSTAVQAGEPTRHWWRFCIGSKSECPYEELELPKLSNDAAG
jgi:hypothetical protein